MFCEGGCDRRRRKRGLGPWSSFRFYRRRVCRALRATPVSRSVHSLVATRASSLRRRWISPPQDDLLGRPARGGGPGPGPGGHDRDERGQFVFDRLNDGRAPQPGRRARAPHARGTSPTGRSGSRTAPRQSRAATCLTPLAARPEVAEILADRVAQDPADPIRAPPGARPLTTEWGLNAIRAPEVWSTFGDRGEGIVVAQHRHRRALHAPGARHAVPRSQHGRHLRPQLQLVRPGPRLRQPSLGPATTSTTAPTRWGRWSATTATRARTRSASLRTRSGSPPRAARSSSCSRRLAARRPASGCSRRPT